MRTQTPLNHDLTLVDLLRICAKKKDLETGIRLHADILRKKLLEKHPYIGSTLVSMYAKCGKLDKACQVFEELPVQDGIAWNALIAGYSQDEQGEEALRCFEKMLNHGMLPDEVTFVCVLKACGHIRALAKGKQIHHEIVTKGFLHQKHVVLGNALVDMYVRCGALDKAQTVFDELPIRDVVSWSSLIGGYAQKEMGSEALSCFERMQNEGIPPDSITFTFILKACGNMGALYKGCQIHSDILYKGLLKNDAVLSTALVDMYAKCGQQGKAREAFEDLPMRCVGSWNALIAGYAHNGKCDDALHCFQKMQSDDGLSPNTVTFTCILKSCRNSHSAENGRRIHDEIVRKGLLGQRVVLGNALIDMYVKCGAITEAQQVLDVLPFRDVVSWNALLAGYAQLGNIEKIFELYNSMLQDGIRPNRVTFLVLLTLCSHAGLISEGQLYFDTIYTVYHIAPTLEHYACMVDLFARAGDFEKAMTMIKKMSSCDYLPAWSSLLGACAKWGNVKLGRLAFEHSIRLDEKSAGAYVHMSEIYASAGMQEDADMINALKMRNGQW